jgi:hypothetical protein
MNNVMSYGIIYFARNKTGVKIGFTKISLKNKLNQLNTSQISDDFKICNSIYVHKPKYIKEKIIDKIFNKKINRELFDLTDEDIDKLCNEFNIKIEDSDYESESSDYDSESSDYESESSDYESDLESDSDSKSSKMKKNILFEFNKLKIK